MHTRGFTSSSIDQCVFFRKDCVVLVYVDDCLIFSRTKEGVRDCITSIGNQFDITEEGSIEKYLGVDIKWRDDGSVVLS